MNLAQKLSASRVNLPFNLASVDIQVVNIEIRTISLSIVICRVYNARDKCDISIGIL